MTATGTATPRAQAALATTVVLWAAAFPAIQVAVADLGAAGLSVGRLLVASLALALIAPRFGVRLPRRADLPQIVLCGATGMAGYQLLLNAGQRTVPAGTASLLMATVPVISILIAAVALREAPGPRRWVGTFIGLAGAVVIAFGHHGGFGFAPAALLVLAAAVVQAIYHAAQKPLLRGYTGFEVTCYAMWTGTLLTLPWAGELVAAVPEVSTEVLLSLLFLGIGPSAIGFLTWAYAVARVDVSYAATSLYLIPAVAIAVAWIWLHQLPRPVELVGGVIAVLGVAIATYRARTTTTAKSGGPVTGPPRPTRATSR